MESILLKNYLLIMHCSFPSSSDSLAYCRHHHTHIQNSSLMSCASSTETISNSTSSTAVASANSTSNLNDSFSALNGPNSNGSVDGTSIKSGGQLVATTAATVSSAAATSNIKYDELQVHGNKYEHELAVNGNLPTCLPQPKHIRFPDVPYSSELVNELMIFMYTMIATAMQFLHLYRTVWWLPESNTSQTMVTYCEKYCT